MPTHPGWHTRSPAPQTEPVTGSLRPEAFACSCDGTSCETSHSRAEPCGMEGRSRSGPCPSANAVNTRRGPPWETTQAALPAWHTSRQNARTRWRRACPLSPPGGAKCSGLAAQSSSATLSISCQGLPSHCPKSSSASRSSTRSSMPVAAARRLAISIHRCAGEVCTTLPPTPRASTDSPETILSQPGCNATSVRP